MKKIILIIMILIFLSGCNIGLYDLNYFTLPDDAEFLALIQELNTPKKIGSYMLENFTYEPHLFSSPDPYILWKTKKGDCNDLMTFGIFMANYHGYKTFRLEISYNDIICKHYIAVYDEGDYYSITNIQYYHYDFNTFGEIVKYNDVLINKDYTKYVVYDYWNNKVETGYNK